MKKQTHKLGNLIEKFLIHQIILIHAIFSKHVPFHQKIKYHSTK